jgi:hypothetical protein
MFFAKWLVDLSSISGAISKPIPCTSETLVIIYQTTFLHKAEPLNYNITYCLIRFDLGIRKVRRD